MSDDPPVWAIYARLSRKARGRRRNDRETVERQVALNRKYAAQHDLTIDEDRHLYIDNHRSAWKADGARPAWDEMMLAGKRGELAGVLAYKLDRFARNVRDAEDLVDLGDRGVIVDGPKSGRIDCSTAHGKRTFREAAVQAAGESDDTSERVKDALAERAADGLLLGGGRLYGFKVLSAVREDDDDVDARQEPAEVDVIREAAERMLAGEHLAAIAADLNEREITTVRGGQWNGRNLGRMLGSPRYGGYSTLRGEVVGRAAGEPVLDPDSYAQIQALLAGRRRGKRATGLWPLTGVLLCGRCVTRSQRRTMAGHTSSRTRASDGTAPRYYTCSLTNGGCGLTVLAEPVEELVKQRVLADLNDPELAAELSAEASALGGVRAAAQAEVERLDGMLADLEVKRVAGQIRVHAYEAAKGHLDKLVGAAETTLREVGAPAPAGALPAVTEREWDAMTAAEKRTLISRLHLEVSVSPQLPGAARNRFDPRRVQIRP